jgi:DNA-binding TFAR19-related protein (PDSD5 family)
MLMAKVKPNARNVLTRLRLNGGQLATEAAEVIETLLKRLNDANDIIHRRERATRPNTDLATPPPDDH